MYIYAYFVNVLVMMDKETTILKVLGEPNRLRLAVLLAAEGQLCVCQLAAAVDEPEYKVSRHLGIMRAAGLVTARREGTWMYYTLAEPGCPLQSHLIAFLKTGFNSHPTVQSDRKLLKQIKCKT